MSINTDSPPVLPDPATPPVNNGSDGSDDDMKSSFTLSSKQLADAGLTNCKPGDTYTGLVTFKMSDDGTSGETDGQTFEIESMADVAPGTGEGDAGAPAPMPGDASPEAASSAMPAPDGAMPSTEEDMLGYKRPQKSKPFPKIQGLKG